MTSEASSLRGNLAATTYNYKKITEEILNSGKASVFFSKNQPHQKTTQLLVKTTPDILLHTNNCSFLSQTLVNKF